MVKCLGILYYHHPYSLSVIAFFTEEIISHKYDVD